MASIVLGLGTSHTPMLNVQRDEWPNFAESDPTIAVQRDRDGQVGSYDELVTLAPPALRDYLTADSFQSRYDQAQNGIAKLCATLKVVEPDVVVIIGDDQQELLRHENMPAFQVYWGKEIVSRQPSRRLPWDWYNRANTRNYDRDPQNYPVADDLALKIIRTAVAAEFDVAACSGLAEGSGENHAIGFVRQRVMPDRAVPCVPILINTFFPPNQPLPRRCFAFGQMLRHAIESWDNPARVAVIASGGLSHFTIDETLDRDFLEMLRHRDTPAYTALPLAKLNAGTSEIRNWIAAAGALEHLGMRWSDYVPGYRTAAGTGTGIAFAIWE